jgi:hypothetical protein
VSISITSPSQPSNIERTACQELQDNKVTRHGYTKQGTLTHERSSGSIIECEEITAYRKRWEDRVDRRQVAERTDSNNGKGTMRRGF